MYYKNVEAIDNKKDRLLVHSAIASIHEYVIQSYNTLGITFSITVEDNVVRFYSPKYFPHEFFIMVTKGYDSFKVLVCETKDEKKGGNKA
ncbi:unnamed protein product [marine sediment metagenome]|uniref:Uncharacterized protein n=1 Tax=marine sediment metagenome TaxID=412755 RepID=X1U099_9ZZZZ